MTPRWYSAGHRVKLTAHLLFDEILTPVCTPTFLPPAPRLADLTDKTLLHPTRDRRDWLRWLKAAGADALPSGKAQHFDTLDLAMSAALRFGIAIGDLCLLEEDIQARRVVRFSAAARPIIWSILNAGRRRRRWRR